MITGKTKKYVCSRVMMWSVFDVQIIMRRACRPRHRSSHRTLQQLDDSNCVSLWANLGRFKCLKSINLVSRGMCERRIGWVEGGIDALVECVKCGCG